MENLLQPDQGEQQQLDPVANYYEQLVGEGKKYKDQESLAKANWHANQTLELRNKQIDEMRADFLKLREEHMARAKLEDLIAQLSNRQVSNEEHQNVKIPEAQQFDLTKVDELITTKMNKAEEAKRQSENANLVKTKLIERYGNNYTDTVRKQIEDLGISHTEFNEMASRQPKALIKLLELDRQPQQDLFQSPPRSQMSGTFAPNAPKERTWAYYQELKKADPLGFYNNLELQKQLQRDAIRLGDKFADGDFYKYEKPRELQF